METAIEEDEFFKRMRLLEDARKAFEALPASAGGPTPTMLQQPSFTPPNGVGVSPPLTTPTPAPIIANPSEFTKKHIGSIITVSGWERNATFAPKRNSLVWGGPLASTISEITVEMVVLPNIALMTPFVVMEIQGVGGQSEKVYLIPKGDSAHSHYKAINRVIPALGCPWTIRLFDAFAQPLNIGEDTTVVKHIVAPNRFYVSELNDIAHGTTVLVNGVSAVVTSISKDANGVAVETSSPFSSNIVNATVVNVNRQFTLIVSSAF
jgi:hypothetical protein